MSDTGDRISAYVADIRAAFAGKKHCMKMIDHWASGVRSSPIEELSLLVQGLCDISGDTSMMADLLCKHDKDGFISFLKEKHAAELAEKDAAIHNLQAFNSKLHDEVRLREMELKEAKNELSAAERDRDEARKRPRTALNWLGTDSDDSAATDGGESSSFALRRMNAQSR